MQRQCQHAATLLCRFRVQVVEGVADLWPDRVNLNAEPGAVEHGLHVVREGLHGQQCTRQRAKERVAAPPQACGDSLHTPQ